MPKLLIIFFILCLSINCRSEEWIPILLDGREWVVNCISSFTGERDTYIYPFVIKVTGDTILHNGVNAKVLQTSRGNSTSPKKLIAYEENGILYQLDTGGTPQIMMHSWMDTEGLPIFKPQIIYSISDVEECVIDSKIHKRYLLEDWKTKDEYDFWIEGFGNYYRPFSADDTGHSISNGQFPFIEAVWDDGNLTAKREDFLRGTQMIKTNSWVPIIRTDRQWVYGGIDKDGSAYLSYWRFGESERVYGYLYTKAYEFRRVRFPDPKNHGVFEEVAPGTVMPPVWTFEDAGQLSTLYPSYDENETLEELADRTYLMAMTYLFLDEYRYGPEYYWDWFGESLKQQETGEWEYGVYFDYSDMRPLEPVVIDGEKRRRYQIQPAEGDPIVCVEGIGALSHAFLPYILRPDRYPLEQTPRLIYYCDGEGNVIHQFAELPWEESGVTARGLTGKSAEGPLYDLFGRSVNNPVAGSIYIRDGKKILWQ